MFRIIFIFLLIFKISDAVEIRNMNNGLDNAVYKIEPQVNTLPVFNNNMTRSGSNPVITNTFSAGYDFVADPFLIIINNKLYMFFEAYKTSSGWGEIWIATSSDGITWSGYTQVSTSTTHYSHPVAVQWNEKVYIFYTANLGDEVYYRSTDTNNFSISSTWGTETLSASETGLGVTSLDDFTIFQDKGIWYFLYTRETDDILEGCWSSSFITDWDTGCNNMGVLLDTDWHSWLAKIVEPKHVQIGKTTLLYFGGTRSSDNKRAMVALTINDINPGGMDYTFLDSDHIFPLASPTAWDDDNIHSSSAVIWNGQWIFAYDADDGGLNDNWKIGIATMPIQGQNVALTSAIPDAKCPQQELKAGITASTTQTQGQQPLIAKMNEIAVVANTDDTITLFTARAGCCQKIINNGANTAKVFPASGDNLGSGVDTSTTLASGSNVEYCAYDETNLELFN